MPLLPVIIVSLLANFADIFTKPTWKLAQTLLIGAILCTGKRTVTSALRAMGLEHESNFSKYHRVLNKAKWDSWQAVKILLGLLLALVPSGSPVLIAMDETLERRKGKKIAAKGCYRDACRSTKSLVIQCYGLKWQCAAMLIKLPWADRYWAMPFMTVLCVAKTYDSTENGYKVQPLLKKNTKLDIGTLGYYKKKLYYAGANMVTTLLDDRLQKKLTVGILIRSKQRQKLKLIRQNIHKLGKKDMLLFTSLTGIRRIPHKSSVDYALLMMIKISKLVKDWILLGDGGFACVKLGLACQRRKVTLISRLRKDAMLFEPAPILTEKKRGRKRLKGDKAKTLHELISQPDLAWEEHEANWYGGAKRNVKLFTGTNLWYKAGNLPLSIRWVLVQDTLSGNTEAFFSTDVNLPAVKIVEYFVLRWNIETKFEEVRAHLGVETQRQWSDNAINRTTPILMGLFSLVNIMAHKLACGTQIPTLITAWYDKNGQATFADVLQYVKGAIMREKYLNKSWIKEDLVQITVTELEDILNYRLRVA
jgi:hypothetical protein